MEKFRAKLKKRLALVGVYNCILLAGYIIGRRYNASDIVLGFASGSFIGIEFVIIYLMGKYATALKNDEKLKMLYIAENDERKKFIESKIGGTGINIILGGIALGTIISGFINETVFFTLMVTLMFSLLIRCTLKLYYRKKV